MNQEFVRQTAAQCRRRLRRALAASGHSLRRVRSHPNVAGDEGPPQRFRGERTGLGRLILQTGSTTEKAMSLLKGLLESNGNRHPGNFPGGNLVAKQCDLPSSQLEGQQIRLGTFHERRRANDGRSKSGDRPADIETAAVGDHATTGDDRTVDFNARGVDATVRPRHKSPVDVRPMFFQGLRRGHLESHHPHSESPRPSPERVIAT